MIKNKQTCSIIIILLITPYLLHSSFGYPSDYELSRQGQFYGQGFMLGIKEGMTPSSETINNLAKSLSKGGDLDNVLSALSKTTGSHASNMMYFVQSNYVKLIGIGLLSSIGGHAVSLGFKLLEKNLMQPKLIIESSKKSLYTKILSIFSAEEQTPLEMVFNKDLKKQLDYISKIAALVYKKNQSGSSNAKYRNLMLYGPPGTGKTMFAKQLAKSSGLDYAFMSGSSFSKFNDGEAILALDDLFTWAKRSNGLLIFIDEAEAFLSKRENMNPQSKAYQLLNSFLNYTGERSSQFMLVFATNHKDVLDSAMYRRIDDLVEMPLPSKEQRLQTLELYKNEILLKPQFNSPQVIESTKKTFSKKLIDQIADMTKGLSYGDLSVIINNIKTDVEIQDPEIVTQELVMESVIRGVKKYNDFTKGEFLGYIID